MATSDVPWINRHWWNLRASLSGVVDGKGYDFEKANSSSRGLQSPVEVYFIPFVFQNFSNPAACRDGNSWRLHVEIWPSEASRLLVCRSRAVPPRFTSSRLMTPGGVSSASVRMRKPPESPTGAEGRPR
jgi:hypothetical protein